MIDEKEKEEAAANFFIPEESQCDIDNELNSNNNSPCKTECAHGFRRTTEYVPKFEAPFELFQEKLHRTASATPKTECAFSSLFHC